MDSQRITAALQRIEAAADRIAIRAQQAGDQAGAVHDPDLVARHARLRQEAGAALADLDQLILELDR